MKEAVKQALQETLEPILTQIRTEASAFIVTMDTRLSSAEAAIDDHTPRIASLEVRVQELETVAHTHAPGPPDAGTVIPV